MCSHCYLHKQCNNNTHTHTHNYCVHWQYHTNKSTMSIWGCSSSIARIPNPNHNLNSSTCWITAVFKVHHCCFITLMIVQEVDEPSHFVGPVNCQVFAAHAHVNNYALHISMNLAFAVLGIYDKILPYSLFSQHVFWVGCFSSEKAGHKIQLNPFSCQAGRTSAGVLESLCPSSWSLLEICLNVNSLIRLSLNHPLPFKRILSGSNQEFQFRKAGGKNN